jgi:hypothetical protein
MMVMAMGPQKMLPASGIPTMNWYYREPTLDEMLSDSIVRAILEADRIDPQELAATLRQAGRKLVRRACVVPDLNKREPTFQPR